MHIGTVHHNIYASGSLEMNAGVQSFPLRRHPHTVDKSRFVGVSDGHYVVIVDKTITIDVFILDVTRFHLAERHFLVGAITDIVPIFEKSQRNQSAVLAHLIATVVFVGKVL